MIKLCVLLAAYLGLALGTTSHANQCNQILISQGLKQALKQSPNATQKAWVLVEIKQLFEEDLIFDNLISYTDLMKEFYNIDLLRIYEQKYHRFYLELSGTSRALSEFLHDPQFASSIHLTRLWAGKGRNTPLAQAPSNDHDLTVMVSYDNRKNYKTQTALQERLYHLGLMIDPEYIPLTLGRRNRIVWFKVKAKPATLRWALKHDPMLKVMSRL